MEIFSEFAERLSKDVGCYYHRTPKAPAYSLKKHNTNEKGRMGVLGWVSELKRINSFRIDSYKSLADIAGVTELADEILRFKER